MLFSTSSVVIALTLALSATARPYEKRWGPWGGWGAGASWKPSPASIEFDKRWSAIAQEFDVDNAQIQAATKHMSLTAVQPALPSPASGQQLFQVVIGRGTQNYTCDLANATATPVPVGALATLYDATTVAAKWPALLHEIPKIAYKLPLPSSDDPSSPFNTMISGHHYFLDDTTPFFNMDTSTYQYGMGALAKTNASDAPAVPKKHGAVQWLLLDKKPFVEDSWSQVYRLNTHGGTPPKTCKEIGAPTIEVDYAAEYWIFK